MSAVAFQWTDGTVREALGLRLTPGNDPVEYGRITTDSRSIEEGDLYVALIGDHFDGHDFVPEAFAAGARGAVVSRPVVGERGPLYPVSDTLVALGQLAHFRRGQLTARVIGITGSSGKTGTKALVAAALQGVLRVHATPGNFNNRIGLPLTILSAPDDAEVLVLEMGTNEPGEIGVLAEIAQPDVGVITTIGPSHLEKLGSIEGVLAEKLALIESLAPGAPAVVGDEPEELAEAGRAIAPQLRVVGFSDRADEEFRPTEVEVDHWGHHSFQWRGRTVSLRSPGRHVVVNALLALTVAEELGVRPRDSIAGVSSVEPEALRGEVRNVGSLTLILDCYNANPQSIGVALDLLEDQGSGVRRIAILGTMLELGEASEAFHREVLRNALTRDLDVVVATGAFADVSELGDLASNESGPRLIAEQGVGAAYSRLRESLEGGEVILLKASRGVALESIVPLFERDFGEAA